MNRKKRPQITIRHTTDDDAPAMSRCAEDAYRRYVVLVGKPPAPMFSDYVFLAGEPGTFVAEMGGIVVGIVVLMPKDGGIWLDNVAVLPEHQGKGIGGELVRFAEDEARRQGFHEINLYTNEAMTENLKIYSHMGYMEVGRWPEDGYRRVYFRKELDPRLENPRQPS